MKVLEQGLVRRRFHTKLDNNAAEPAALSDEVNVSTTTPSESGVVVDFIVYRSSHVLMIEWLQLSRRGVTALTLKLPSTLQK